jgi:hypothetical protein
MAAVEVERVIIHLLLLVVLAVVVVDLVKQAELTVILQLPLLAKGIMAATELVDQKYLVVEAVLHKPEEMVFFLLVLETAATGQLLLLAALLFFTLAAVAAVRNQLTLL